MIDERNPIANPLKPPTTTLSPFVTGSQGASKLSERGRDKIADAEISRLTT